MDIYDDVDVLAAEVDRLRVELQQTLDAHERQAASIRELQAAIARVEALCSMNHADSLIRVGDIRAALQDER